MNTVTTQDLIDDLQQFIKAKESQPVVNYWTEADDTHECHDGMCEITWKPQRLQK